LNPTKKFSVGKIYTDRYLAGHDEPSFQLVHEWEDQVSALTQLPICDSRPLRRWRENFVARNLVRIPGAFALLQACDTMATRETKSLYFAMSPQYKTSFSVRANVIPIIVDFWKSVDLRAFYRTYINCPMVLISSLEAFNFLRSMDCPLNLCHFPLSLPDKYRTSPDSQFEKQYDVLIAGRPNPVLNEFLQRYERENPSLEYVYQTVVAGNFCYSSNKSGIIGAFNDRASYVRLLRASRVGLYSTPGIDGGEKRTGGFNPVTPRLFELLAAACHVVARYPDNDDTRFFELNEICPSVDSYADFAATLKVALNTPPPVKRHHVYLQKHYTSARVDLLNRLVDITN
jgi:hypothetical protein